MQILSAAYPDWGLGCYYFYMDRTHKTILIFTTHPSVSDEGWAINSIASIEI